MLHLCRPYLFVISPFFVASGWLWFVIVTFPGYLHFNYYHLSRNVTKQSDICARQNLKSACAFALSDQSLRCPHAELCILGYPKYASEDSDQTVRVRSLIRAFAGRKCPKIRYLTLRLMYICATFLEIPSNYLRYTRLSLELAVK